MHKRVKWRSIGWSVIGPGHLQEGLPNQDSWLVQKGRGFLIAVVSDGLGSHPHSDTGSKAACSAVAEAVQQWIKRVDREESDLLRLIQTLWLMKIRPIAPAECGATCLWAIVWNDGRVLAGRLGDGMILVDHGEGRIQILEENKEGYANQTEALSGSGILSKWEVSRFSLSAPESCVCLMTDGISEDLDRKRLKEVANIFRPLFRCSKRKGAQFLKKELFNWTAPNHLDDKTIVVLFRR